MEFSDPPVISMTSTKEGLLDYCCLVFAGKERASNIFKQVNGIFENFADDTFQQYYIVSSQIKAKCPIMEATAYRQERPK